MLQVIVSRRLQSEPSGQQIAVTIPVPLTGKQVESEAQQKLDGSEEPQRLSEVSPPQPVTVSSRRSLSGRANACTVKDNSNKSKRCIRNRLECSKYERLRKEGDTLNEG